MSNAPRMALMRSGRRMRRNHRVALTAVHRSTPPERALPLAMAGLLARGSPPFADLPGFPVVKMASGSPLTVAGAATALAPSGSSAPCSLLIPWSLSVGAPSHENHRRPFRGASIATREMRLERGERRDLPERSAALHSILPAVRVASRDGLVERASPPRVTTKAPT